MTFLRELLEIEDLRVEFSSGGRSFSVVSGVDLKLRRGRTLGLVGESGCGKTVTALSILRLVPDPPGRIAGGRIWFEKNQNHPGSTFRFTLPIALGEQPEL